MDCFDDVFACDNYALSKKTFLIVVIYDISNTKRRNGLIKILKSYGQRVQMSVFECKLTNNLYEKLVSDIDTYVENGEQIKVYKLTGNATIRTWGDMRDFDDEDMIFI